MGNWLTHKEDRTAKALIVKISKVNLEEFSIYKRQGTYLVGVYEHVGKYLSMVEIVDERDLDILTYIANRGKQLLDCCKCEEPLSSLETVEIATLGMNIMKNALDLVLSFEAISNGSFKLKEYETRWKITSQLLQEEYGKQDNSLSTVMDQEQLKCYLKDYIYTDDYEKKRAQLLLEMLDVCFNIRSNEGRINLSTFWPKVPSDDIVQGAVLGRGSFGIVYEIELYGEKFACKIAYYDQMIDEANVHFTLQHANIVRAVCCASFPDNKFGLVMELMNEKNLRDFLDKSNPRVDWKRVNITVDIICQIADAMCYLHKNNIIHRDLKAKNILVEGAPDLTKWMLHVKLGDLGTARPVGVESTSLTYKTGTLSYMAPEVRRGEGCENGTSEYGLKADVYSFGMTCYEILTGSLPANPHVPEFPDITPYKLQILIKECWEQNPAKRPSFGEIVWRTRNLKCGLSKIVTVPPSSHSERQTGCIIENLTMDMEIRLCEELRNTIGPVICSLLPGDRHVMEHVSDRGTYIRFGVWFRGLNDSTWCLFSYFYQEDFNENIFLKIKREEEGRLHIMRIPRLCANIVTPHPLPSGLLVRKF